MSWIYVWTSEIKNIYVWTTPVKEVYVWTTKVRPSWPAAESIVYKMNANSNGKLFVPVGWYSHSNTTDCAYNWNVSVDWWTATNYSWTWGSGWSITLSWYTAWSSHTITITPTTEDYWWALSYWWYNTAWATYLTEVVYDWSYMGYWESATSTWNYFRLHQYRWCTSLITAPTEVLPSSVTSIWNSFRRCQYYWCTSLTTAPEEVLPDTVTSIGTYFRYGQYRECTSLTTISWWKDLSIGDSRYRYYQFYNCTASKTVKVLSDVWYASYNSDTLQSSYVTSVSVPSAYLSNFTWASVQPRSSITDSKFVGY